MGRILDKKYNIVITHLYPDLMNIYGDVGNIIALQRRCEWRDIQVTVREVTLKDTLPEDTDIYFIGGGQDEDQLKVYEDLLEKRNILIHHIKMGVAMLAVCGGYQLLGKHFYSGDKKDIQGIGLLDIETKASSRLVNKRAIGNCIIRINEKVFERNKTFSTLVGFENHSGQTFLGHLMAPLGTVISGVGNNMEDDTEGCVYKNVIGTYLHGSFLPKNPHIADWLVNKAMKRKYSNFSLSKLNDQVELDAHNAILKRFT